MKIRCAWCTPAKIIGEKEGGLPGDITDGICDDCLVQFFPHVAGKVQALEMSEADRYGL